MSAQYHEAWEAAREPGEYHRLPELLNLWWLNSIAFSDPTYDQRAEEAARGAGEVVAFEEAGADLRDLALVLARSVADTGERVSLDEVIAAFGHSRESLAALPDDE
ncbi:hypothetical protein ACQP2T_02610 [Nonomuraea sp. CA-143628]|uniref:hypothetical protein n=1 Tax=Nonomuraea sp. CA-143628 TaxID=3239997 RepID=UPI003D92DC26